MGTFSLIEFIFLLLIRSMTSHPLSAWIRPLKNEIHLQHGSLSARKFDNNNSARIFFFFFGSFKDFWTKNIILYPMEWLGIFGRARICKDMIILILLVVWWVCMPWNIVLNITLMYLFIEGKPVSVNIKIASNSISIKWCGLGVSARCRDRVYPYISNNSVCVCENKTLILLFRFYHFMVNI